MNDVPLQHLEEAVSQAKAEAVSQAKAEAKAQAKVRAKARVKALEEQSRATSVLPPGSDGGPAEIMRVSLLGVFAESIASFKQEVLDAVDAKVKAADHKTEKRMQELLSIVEAKLKENEHEKEKRKAKKARVKAREAAVEAREAELKSQQAAFALEKAVFESWIAEALSQGVAPEQSSTGSKKQGVYEEVKEHLDAGAKEAAGALQAGKEGGVEGEERGEDTRE